MRANPFSFSEGQVFGFEENESPLVAPIAARHVRFAFFLGHVRMALYAELVQRLGISWGMKMLDLNQRTFRDKIVVTTRALSGGLGGARFASRMTLKASYPPA